MRRAQHLLHVSSVVSLCGRQTSWVIFSGGGGVGSQGGGGGQEPHRWGVHALVRPGELVAHFAELALAYVAHGPNNCN